MSRPVHINGYLTALHPLWSRPETEIYDWIDFERSEGFERPANWSPLATEVFAATAAYAHRPARTAVLEENTVPSWLWRHVPADKKTASAAAQPEDSARQVFDRVAGSAIYRGWKLHLFANDDDAHLYFDELRYALAQRWIILDPSVMAKAGIDWAYGQTPKPAAVETAATTRQIATLDIDNHTIDTVVSGRTTAGARELWQQALAARTSGAPTRIRFVDTIRQWGGDETTEANTPAFPVAVIDLLALRHAHGGPNSGIDITLLKHLVRLTVTLLDLQYDDATPPGPIGSINLAALLMSLAIAYDSDAGRATAAALSALITAEVYIVSAELAKLRGKNPAFTTHADGILRSLRNHARAAYGDQADYERTSILPMPLELSACADLALVAEAQRSWTKALDVTRKHGLRQFQATAFGLSPQLACIAETGAQDTAPLPELTCLQTDDGESFRRVTHPAVAEALRRLRYDRAKTATVIHYIEGHHSLENAPAINHATLRAAGFDDAALDHVEAYLPYAKTLRQAVTPWIVGEAFCHKQLKISAAKLNDPAFDLLRHLGFSTADIAAADAYCFGHLSLAAMPELNAQHRAVFAVQADLDDDARIRMAASVQSFVSNDVTAYLSLPMNLAAEKVEKIFLNAWRQGLKSITVAFDRPEAAPVGAATEARTPNRIRRAAFLHTQKPELPQRKLRAKAQTKLVSGKPKLGKTTGKSKH